MFTTTRTNNQKFHLKDTSISNKTRGKCPLTTIIRKNLQFSRIIHNHYNIFVRRYGGVSKFGHKKDGHLDRLLGDYQNEKSYLGLMIVYPEQLKGGLNAKISSFS